MTSFDGNNQIRCHEAQLLMSACMEDDPSLTQAQREAFEAHLLACSACREEYDEDRQLITLVRKYWGPISEDTRKLLEKGGYPIAEQEKAPRHRARPMTVEESWEDLKRRSPGLADACRRQEEKDRRRRFFWRIGSAAAAANILIAVGLGWLTLRNGNSSRPVAEIAANHGGSPAAFAEMVTDQGRKPLALNQPVATIDQPQEILLGGIHRVVMNTDTVASFGATPAQSEDRIANDKVAYEIQLAKGGRSLGPEYLECAVR